MTYQNNDPNLRTGEGKSQVLKSNPCRLESSSSIVKFFHLNFVSVVETMF
jgi:hypothetical protein